MDCSICAKPISDGEKFTTVPLKSSNAVHAACLESKPKRAWMMKPQRESVLLDRKGKGR